MLEGGKRNAYEFPWDGEGFINVKLNPLRRSVIEDFCPGSLSAVEIS